MENRLKVTVDRSRWFRGQGGEKSRLLMASGKMCCLGFACIAAGHTSDEIMEVATPNGLERELLPGVEQYRKALSGDMGIVEAIDNPIHRAINVNDDVRIIDQERESQLQEILAQVGIDMEFVDSVQEG